MNAEFLLSAAINMDEAAGMNAGGPTIVNPASTTVGGVVIQRETFPRFLRENPTYKHAKYAGYVYQRAVRKEIKLDADNFIKSTTDVVLKKKHLYSVNTLKRLLRAYARGLNLYPNQGSSSTNVLRSIWDKQFSRTVNGKVPFRPVPFHVFQRYRVKVFHFMDNEPDHFSGDFMEKVDGVIENFDYPPHSYLFDEWFEYADGKTDDPIVFGI